MTRQRHGVMAFGGTFFLILLFCLPALTQEKRTAQETAYVGADTCKACHPELFEAFRKDTPHWKSYEDPKIPPERKGCEACHGAGSDYKAMNIMKDRNLAKQNGLIIYENEEAIKALCLKCHKKDNPYHSVPEFNFNIAWKSISHYAPK